MAGIRLIAGLGNPGPRHRDTPHNVGALWVEELAERFGVRLSERGRFKGRVGRGELLGREVLLLVPSTYMNLSGESVGPLAHYYRVAPPEILIAHDEVDFPPGVSRLKVGGRRGTHNGIASVAAGLGNRSDFARLRIGVGHPGRSRMVGFLTGSRLPRESRELVGVGSAMDDVLLGLVLDGEWQMAMNRFHAPAADDAGDPGAD